MGDLLRLAVLEAENIELRRLLRERTDELIKERNIELRRLLRERTDELIKERIAHKDCCNRKEDKTDDNDGTQEGQA